MFSALLAGALIVVASLLLGSAIMAIAGLPRHSAAGPATGISGAARDLRDRDQAARACGDGRRRHRCGAAGLLRGLRAHAGPGRGGADRSDRGRDRGGAGGRHPVRDQRAGRNPRPGAGQRRHGLAPALHGVDHLARRADPRPDQGRLSARAACDRRRDREGERRQFDRGVRRADRRDRRPARADGIRRARRHSRLAAGARGGSGGEPLPGGRISGPGCVQGAVAGVGPARASHFRFRRCAVSGRGPADRPGPSSRSG